MTLPTLAVPAITAGGLCCESKSEVLTLLGPDGRSLLAPYTSFAVNQKSDGDVQAARAALAQAGLSFPIVAKPDVGRRGTGIRVVRDPGQLDRYLKRFPRGQRVMLQQLVPHQGEAGVFYVRMPGERRGRIISLTLKYFPHVIGDGYSTLRELILADPRAGRISRVYFRRLARDLDRIPANGEQVQLVFMGNHCKGAIFRNGAAYLTEEMHARFDRIAKEMPGFNFGRFDVRFRSLDDLRRGAGFTILEINGAGSEATHIWDRDTTVRDAYAALRRQVRSAFEIGSMHRRVGLKPMGPVGLLRLYLRERKLMRSYPSDEAA
jgi:D-alanine-D-alanine ligase-like ATP-grasp enzyme